MGTSGSYGGSGGQAWTRARARARKVISNLGDDEIANLVNATLDAMGLPKQENETSGLSPASFPSATPPLLPKGLAGISGLRGAGSKGSAGAAGGTGAGVGTGRGRGGISLVGLNRRNRRAAAHAGGFAIGAAEALRMGDGTTLAELGLDLGALARVDPFGQCDQILELMGAAGTLEADELQTAIIATLLEMLPAGTASDPIAAIRTFISSYLFEIITTEFGPEFRNAAGGTGSLEVEGRIRGYIEARVAQVQITLPGADRIRVTDIETAIAQALIDVRDVTAAAVQ